MQYSLFPSEELQTIGPLVNRVVCVLGTFPISGKALQKKLQQAGARYAAPAQLSRNVHYVLMGDNPAEERLAQLEKLRFNGFCPRVLGWNDLERILQGFGQEYHTSAQIQKDLHLSRRHYELFHTEYPATGNPFYTKELYVAEDVRSAHPGLFQQLGDMGIYANTYLDERTDLLVVSRRMLDELDNGLRDNAVAQYIEKTYNQSKAPSYRYVMTTDEELLLWLSKKASQK